MLLCAFLLLFRRLAPILRSGDGNALGLGAGFDPAGAGAPSSSSSPPGNMTFKNATITSGGKTTIMSTGTTTFVDDTETTFSQTMSSDVGLLWQKQRDTGVHKETAQSTTINTVGGSSTSAAGGVVTETPTPADKTWNDKKESMTPAAQALVGIAMTAATLLTGGTAAGALGITNAVGAAAFNAGAMSFGTQMAINTINNKGDVGKALEGVSAKQIAVATAAAALSAGVISHISPDVTPRLDANFKAGAGAGTKLAAMGTTQSASFAGSATQATSAVDWVNGFATRLPVHGVQTITNVAANAVLADGDPSAIGNAALGSLATMVGSEATLPLGQAYHAGQVNPFVHKVAHGAIGAGTAVISGGNVWAGAAGAVAAELAGEVYLNHKLAQGPITPDQASDLVNTTASIGRIAGGLAGFAAGGDPNTGANVGTVAVENNAAQVVIPYIIGAAAGSMAASTLYEAGGNPDVALQKLGSGDHPLARALAEGTAEAVTLSAEKFPEATKLALQTLSLPGVATNTVVTFADDQTGNVTSKTWGSLSLETQNRLKGAGVIALSIPAAAVTHLANAAKVGKVAQVVGKVDGDTKIFSYNAVENPGPLANLPNNPAANFFAGRYNSTTLNEDLILYRGGKEGAPLGQWFTREPPESVTKIRIDSAVKTQWIDPQTNILTGTSEIDTLYAIKIPKGQTIYEGPVGYQGGIYLGGPDKNQVFVPTPWKIPGVEKIWEKPIR